MANKKISELLVATSSLATDDLVIRRGSDNFKIASGLLTSTNNPVISSSISGITQTFTKQDSSTYTNEIVSASFAVSASYALSASVEVRKEVSSSYADTASVSLRNSGVLSNGALVDVFSYDGSTDVVVDISTYSSSAATSLTNISSSLTSTNQTISSSVASLSGSASDARNLLVADLDTISSSTSTARDVLASQVSGAFSSDSSSFSTRITTLEEFSSSLDATYTTNTELNEATASLSGSASDARNQLTSDYLAADTTLSSSVSTERVKYVKEVTSIGDNLISVTKGDGSTNNITIVTSSFVKTVNGNGPDGVGNVAVALASTSTGLSSSFPTSPDDADVYIISGETIEARTSSNGEIFIYSTASSQWYQITSPDQTSNDVRYVQVAGDTMTGALTLPSNPTAALHAATKQYVDNVTTVGTDGQTIVS